MLAFQAGDRAAFEALFRRHTPPLVSFLARMVKDRGRAEELAQEVFIRIYSARERYQAKARFSTWMFGIAHNLALNDLDRAYRKRERPLGDGAEIRSPDPSPGPDQQLDARRAGERLETALSGLPERQRAALLLRAQQGLAYDEIAEALGVSRSSVKSLIHRAREGLARQLDDGLEEAGS
jgi:RNA polymerase sigma-70 factor (ECF subfamily)